MAQMLAKQLTETGKIRIGCQVPIAGGRNAGKPRPEKLKAFRLTSNSRAALMIAAQRYGGTVQSWTVRPEWAEAVRPPEQAWELFTESDTLDILIRGDGLLGTLFERWEGAYCALRCNGEVILKDGHGTLAGKPCVCPTIPEERKALAAQGKACSEVSRVVVMLEGLPPGQWRLDTRGFYAPAEIRALQELLEECAVSRAILKATMRLEQRTDHKLIKGERQILNYPCIVIEPRQATEQLLIEGERRRHLAPPRPDESQKTLAQQCQDLYGTDPALPPAQIQAPPVSREVLEGDILPAEGVPAMTATLRQQIDVWQAQQGLTSQQRMQWRGQQVRRLKARSFAHIPLSVLEALWADMQETAADAAAGETISAFALPLEEAPMSLNPDGWREQLMQAAENLKGLADNYDAPEHQAAMLALTAQAVGLAENPDATAADGASCFADIHQLGDAVARQLGLPI